MFLLVVFVSAETGQGMAIRPVSEIPADAFLISAVAAGALYWRRRMPLAAWGVAMLGAAGSLAIGSWNIVGVAVIALYSVGRYVSDHRWSYLSAASTIGLAAVGDRVDGLAAADSVGGLVVIFLLWYAGRRIRFRGERAAQVERERAAEARRAVAEERTRIARELHDVVAHRVSMMTVQAGAAKMVVADDPGGARRAMEAVEHTGREALDELRHLLTVLRPVAGAGDLGPQPGLLDVPRLLDQLREAGLDVSLTTHGALPDLPTRVSLSAYRIIQEALTNVLRHAGPACRAEVRLSTDGAGVAIEVLDDGSGVAALSGSGHGIVGMRERALLLGGSLDAGQRPSGGFQVTAWLPLREEPA
ncbi:signal transduction histidine kinase [Micromonospora sp. Llam0]|uniref:sensor histidine kinase n=1 Tax=Micromonospora sp. Llam0 TaxID=2485143 RepID=UPI000F99174E|nr:sensor histidine kinase [Micromonospora sp. Llam0]ROO50741.1 signal transduction histidine kinase [Micromonospora sp. Llam0]